MSCELSPEQAEAYLNQVYQERKPNLPFEDVGTLYKALVLSTDIRAMKKLTWYQCTPVNFDDGLWETF